MKSCALFFLTFTLSFAVESTVSPLKLTDGRSFEQWSIIGQTDKHVTIKYQRGGVQVDKRLLPPELLAKYPIIEEKIAPKPEPGGLEKPGLGIRMISETVTMGTSVFPGVWKVTAGREPGSPMLTLHGEYKVPSEDAPHVSFDIPLHNPNEFGQAVSALFKAKKWARQAYEGKASEFTKIISKEDGNTWVFVWKNGEAGIVTDNGSIIRERDFTRVEKLFDAVPAAFDEVTKAQEIEARTAAQFK